MADPATSVIAAAILSNLRIYLSLLGLAVWTTDIVRGSSTNAEIDEPELLDETANNRRAGVRRVVGRGEVYDACRVMRANEGGAVDYQFAGGHEETTRLRGFAVSSWGSL